MEGKFFFRKYLIWVILLLGQIHGYKSCIEEERKALLDLKKYLISVTEESWFHYVLPTWTNDTKSDCCHWEGVKCNRTSQRVTEIAFNTPFFKQDSLLNLSLLHPFEYVRSLDISRNFFIGLFDDVEGYKSLGRLRNLEILNLASNKFNNSIFPFLNAATSLTTLFIQKNRLSGHFPAKEFKDLTNLELMDMSGNKFNGSIPIGGFPKLRKMKALDLSSNNFSGSMGLEGKSKHILCYSIKTGGICEMKNIQELDLSQNKLVGQFPLCLNGLTGLQVLDLSSNQLTGKLPSSLGNLKSLKYLSLLDNNFEGFFSVGWLANLSELSVLKLNSKSKLLLVDSEGSWIPKFQLSVIELISCNMVKVPYFLIYQNDLSHIDLSDNKISGDLPHWLLANNKNLEVLFLQNNSFTSFQLHESSHNLLLLDYMKLANNNFQGTLPSSLGNMKEISYMDVSRNNFTGTLPRSFVMGCYSMQVLTLSHNKLSGEVFPESANFTKIRELSMDNNLFSGKIGQGLRSLSSLSLLDISNNNLTGVIPSWIGELPFLYALLLSNNSLEGEIPISLFNIVSILDLRNNRLSGNIPTFTNIHDTHSLLLRGNNLTGNIPRQLCGLRNIQLLDLASNRLNGSIPPCFSNTSFVLGKSLYDNDYSSISRNAFQYTDFKSLIVLDRFRLEYLTITPIKIEFATKHRYDAYVGGNLKLLFGMDLSENELSGDIPPELGGLLELQALNLSHNKLSGSIPKTFSGLKNVESLDLSFNRLHGRIPSQLTELNSLAVFNVSFNNLSGVIPQGKQFNTFDAKSYLGNSLLCGKPTNTSCGSSNFQEPDNEVEAEESTVDMVSFYWSLAAAYVTILLGLFSSLSFDSPWSRFWFCLVDVFITKAKSLLW
ncbi:unnamed protein product [Brassica rapa]|uniref:Leucine-rich repeat-containing N-terminal plant-type domain-containing protein n=1 Tax=Brassica campestris TaxID=3711 RepID=A0A8D9HRP5_BRACM|nr:unnamed protein product [Brassica rapa]